MPLCHAAPEVLTSARYDAKLADIWSAGVMLYTMLCCSYPFEKKEDDPKDLRTQTKIMQRIMRGEVPVPEQSLMADAPSLTMHATHSNFMLHRSVRDHSPENDNHLSVEKDSDAHHLVSSHPLLLQQMPCTHPGCGSSSCCASTVFTVRRCWPVAGLTPDACAVQRSTSGHHRARSARSARISSARCWWPTPGGGWQSRTSRWAAVTA